MVKPLVSDALWQRIAPPTTPSRNSNNSHIVTPPVPPSTFFPPFPGITGVEKERIPLTDASLKPALLSADTSAEWNPLARSASAWIG